MAVEIIAAKVPSLWPITAEVNTIKVGGIRIADLILSRFTALRTLFYHITTGVKCKISFFRFFYILKIYVVSSPSPRNRAAQTIYSIPQKSRFVKQIAP